VREDKLWKAQPEVGAGSCPFFFFSVIVTLYGEDVKLHRSNSFLGFKDPQQLVTYIPERPGPEQDTIFLVQCKEH
jgi:hypothetical protein